MLSSPVPRADRRTVLTALLAGAALAASGCDAALPLRSAEEASPGAQQPADPAPPSEEEADSALLEQATEAIAAAMLLVVATAARYPGLDQALAPITAMHRAHLEVLDAPDPDSPAADGAAPDTTAQIRGRRRGALREVRRQETDLRLLLADLAVRAHSGPLARVLASMAAATGQRILLLPGGQAT